jgi:glycosyltransferase involved in cell wall biosynthesis
MAGSGKGFDTVFVQIGNSWSFHAGFLRLIHRIPSVVVLHDLAVQELCADAIRNRQFPSAFYEREMARWHGAHGAACAADVLDGRRNALDLARDIPGFEITLDRAISVLVHTRSAYDAVNATAALPSYLLDLPFRPGMTRPSAARTRQGPLKFVQFGYIGLNRRLLDVVEALAPLRDDVDFNFDIMGKVWDPQQVLKRVHELGLEDRVTLHGFVAESELDARLAEAHLVFNLRYPTMGEASGSQLRIWNASAASVVTDHGWYGTLDDETVFKIPYEREAEALRRLVRSLNADRTLGIRIGHAGRARLEARHAPARYARAVAHVAVQAPRDAHDALFSRQSRHLLGRNAATRTLQLRRLAARF